METLHRWLWSTFGGSAMLWDVALGVLAGAVLICLCVFGLGLTILLAGKVLEAGIDGLIALPETLIGALKNWVVWFLIIGFVALMLFQHYVSTM